MSRVLVDTSIWKDFFRGNKNAEPLKGLIADDRILTNELILAELLPSIHHKREHRLREILMAVKKKLNYVLTGYNSSRCKVRT